MKACFYAFVLQLPRYMKIRWCNMKNTFKHLYCNYQGTWKSGDAIVEYKSMLLWLCTTITKVHENQVMQYEEYFQKWCDLTRFCLHLDSWHFLCWRNFGSILFVLQNSWHFQTVEEFRIYFIYTNQNWAPIFQIMTLFYFIDIFKVS